MNKLSFALAAAVSAVAAFAGSRADAQITFNPQLTLGTSIAVSCVNSGSGQEVAKTPSLKNDTGKTIPAGRNISWKASDGDSGTLKLAADLAPGGTVKLQGSKPGNVYTCSAFFFASPDLVPTKAQISSATTVSIAVANRDAFAGANLSIAKVEIYSCAGALLQAVETPAFTMAPGETKSFSLTIKPVSGKTFVRVTADSEKRIHESNEANNILDTMNACVQ